MNPGEVFDRYRVVRLLGAGAYADVYLAEHVLLGTRHALTSLRKPLNPGALEALFAGPARLSTGFTHPGIARVTDVIDELEAQVLVMDYAVDGSLADAMVQAGGPLSLELCIDVVLELLDVLAWLHDRMGAHGSLRPANVLLARDANGRRRTTLSEIGLAALYDEADGQGRGGVLGELRYLSPEQVRGEAPDHRSDLFTLGAILYEMVTGQPAFDGPTPFATMNRVSTADYVSPELLLTKVDPLLVACLRRAMAVDPEHRFQDCAGFADVLLAIAEGLGRRVRSSFSAESRTDDLHRILRLAGQHGVDLGTVPPAPTRGWLDAAERQVWEAVHQLGLADVGLSLEDASEPGLADGGLVVAVDDDVEELHEPPPLSHHPIVQAFPDADAALVYNDGELDEQVYPWTAPSVSVGRGRDNDIRTRDDKRTSRHHCRFVREGGRYFVIDGGSANGTLVDGRRVPKAELLGGETVQVGGTRLRFRLL